MNEEKEPGKYPAIVGLGVIIAVLAATLVFLNLAWKTGKLSPEKMRLAAEGTESVYEENQADYQEDTQVEELASFSVSAKGGKQEKGENPDYLCSYSSDRRLTEDDVEELESKSYSGLPEGKDVIRMVINELYAKHGFVFENEEIQSYFEDKEWYREIEDKSDDMDEVAEKMSGIEKDNLRFLSSLDKEEG